MEFMEMMLLSGLIVLLGVVGSVMLFDAVPQGREWLSRIHIGRYEDISDWRKSITQTGIRWLNRIPVVKVTDQTRLVIIDRIKGNYSRPAIQQWQEAALVMGVSEYAQAQGDPQAQKQLLHYLSGKLDGQGAWVEKPQHVDGAILAYALLKLDSGSSNSYKRAYDQVWEMIQTHIGSDGTVMYRSFMPAYRYVDTIGFICPFLVRYGLVYDKQECIELAMRQIREYVQHGMLEEHFIPCHAYRLEDKSPLGLYGWGRGLGWFAIGLMDAWKELPHDHADRAELERLVRRFALSAIRYQQSHGGWSWTVTRKESRVDSSTTAIMGWFMLNAAVIPEIAEECKQSADRAIAYLMKVTRRDGAVDFSQGDTKDIGVYSMLFSVLPFTQGFCMRLMNLYKQDVS